jgi:hypothetical protein
MRNTVLVSSPGALLVIGVLVAPARADHKYAAHPAGRVAELAAGPSATGSSLSTGALGALGALSTAASRMTGAAGPAAETTVPTAQLEAFLEPGEVTTDVAPYAPAIERCYLGHLVDVRRAGKLDLTLVIGRDGYVVSLTAAAPSLPARSAREVQSCIREAVDAVHFPVRRHDTTAIVPYFFQHTNTPGGGPQLSCWDPKGCHVEH